MTESQPKSNRKQTAARRSLEQLVCAEYQPGTTWSRWDRPWQIAANYRWSQIARRLAKLIRRELFKQATIGPLTASGPFELGGSPRLNELAELFVSNYVQHRSHARGDMTKGSLCLLNHTVQTGWPIEWIDGDKAAPSHLWRFHFHYHEFLLSYIADHKVAEQPTSAWDHVWSVIDSWIEHYPPESTLMTADAWHPYCISRRVPVWLWLLIIGQPAVERRDKILTSVIGQIDYLCRNLETDLGGNHLLENLFTIGLAAGTIDSPSRPQWLRTVEAHLERELWSQVLAHGEHFELSPTYHCQMLSGVLRMALVIEGINTGIYRTCISFAQRMIEFLESILHPDGEVPLLGDSGLGEAPSVATIRELANLVCMSTDEQISQPESPYFSVRVNHNQRDESFLLYDMGATAARNLPAHGHCDLLGIELSIGGQRWLTESGNFNYEDDSIRQYCRSSVAHNVATIEYQNSSDVWSKFRMGKRGRVLETARGTEGPLKWAWACHDGYASRDVNKLGRFITVADDSMFSCFEYGSGPGITTIQAFLHLNPNVSLRHAHPVAPQSPLVLQCQEMTREIVFFGVDEIELMQGWYCPAFGEKQESTVICYRQHEKRQLPFGWVLQSSQQHWFAEVSANHLLIGNQDNPQITLNREF